LAKADLNVGVRTNLIIKTPLDVYIGPELTIEVNRYGNIEEWKLYFYTFSFNLIAEKWSQNKTFGVGFRFGVFTTSIDIQRDWHDLSNAQQEYFKRHTIGVVAAEDVIYADRLSLNVGADFYWLIQKHLLLNLGINFVHIRPTTDNYPPSGFLCPTLGISYQF